MATDTDTDMGSKKMATVGDKEMATADEYDWWLQMATFDDTEIPPQTESTELGARASK